MGFRFGGVIHLKCMFARHWYVHVKGLTLCWNWWLKPFYCPVRQFVNLSICSPLQSFNFQSVKFQSCNVHPCNLVRQFPVLQIQLSISGRVSKKKARSVEDKTSILSSGGFRSITLTVKLSICPRHGMLSCYREPTLRLYRLKYVRDINSVHTECSHYIMRRDVGRPAPKVTRLTYYFVS